MKKNVLIICLCILAAVFAYCAFEMLVPAQKATENAEIRIPKGATFRQAADILVREKLIRDSNVFLLLGRLTGADRKIKAGYYQIWARMSPFDIFNVLRRGQIVEYQIRVIEGESVPEIADSFAAAGIAARETFMKLARDPKFLSEYRIDAPSIEGYIFPDTYLIPKGMPVEDALGTMINRMREKFSDKMTRRAEELGMNEREVLTLASIIEKEAVIDSERPLISAVYHNRLKKDMLLQADPTCIYGIKSSREKITKEDLLRKTPYNTYVVKGLPPGPIASPGLKSIMAALYPADVPYLYFVSHDDRSHQFSTNIEDHEKAVKLYRERQQAEKKGKEGAS
jgi:peptidoglycan lytic transglycosylase G